MSLLTSADRQAMRESARRIREALAIAANFLAGGPIAKEPDNLTEVFDELKVPLR